MKKKVIVCMTSMYLGGAERSLIGLLEAFDYEKYDVSLFLNDHSGELLKDIPEQVRVLPEKKEYKALEQPIANAVRDGAWKIVLGRTIGKIFSKIYARRFKRCHDIIVGIEYKQKFTKIFLPQINNEEYDLAISFMTPHYVVAEKLKAKTKIAWVHTDYTKMHLDVTSETLMWGKYDYIAAVSEGVAETFKSVFPSLTEKVIVIENILPEILIRKQAEEIEPNYDKGTINILSIGRFTFQKNFDSIPDICTRLVKKGQNVKWYLIGYGPDEEKIVDCIKKSMAEDRVIVLGKKDNPYPYLKACDYYVQPSRYEGKAVTVREAQMLGKPVIITNYPTSESQLTDGYDGVIVPTDNGSCAEGILRVIQNKELTQKLSHSCLQNDYSNKQEIEKLYKLMENRDALSEYSSTGL